MAKRDRGVNVNFWVTQEERSLIEQKMQAAGVTNMRRPQKILCNRHHMTA